jgi:hypothetical protein
MEKVVHHPQVTGAELPTGYALRHAVSGDNERIKVSGLYQLFRYGCEVVAGMAVK